MRSFYYGLSVVWIAICFSLSAASQPDPTQAGTDVLLPNSHGHFVTRTADIFIDDKTNFNQPIATTQLPFLLRAISPYDMHLDPGLDQNGWALDARRQKLTAPGLSRLLAHSSPDIILSTEAGDPILYIDLAAFYDDHESDKFGGFWANWRITVTPVQQGATGLISADAFFLSILRGPFWSGEKSEIADTNDGFRPQVMYYQNTGIWNWHWTIPGFGQADAVKIKLEEGDGFLPNDHIVTYVVWRDETAQAPLTLADTGDVVALSITDDGHFQRTVTDPSRIDPAGRSRIMDNPDGHDVDMRFSTRPLLAPIAAPNQFETRHVIGPQRFKGREQTAQAGWNPAFNQGPTRLRYIDNISYTPGWDCASFPFDDPFDVDDDFEFSLAPHADGVEVWTDRGGCDSRTTLFFRTSDIGLPSDVQVTRTGEEGVRVRNRSPQHFAIPKTQGYEGFAFSELLGYRTNGDDDMGFRIIKGETPTHYTFDVDVFKGNSGSAIEFRATAVEWPSAKSVATDFRSWDTQTAQSGAAHRVFDLPIPHPAQPYVVFHEMLTYQPSGDDDMSWGLYFERLSEHVNVQLSSGNAAGDSGAYVGSEFRILQFPVEAN